MAVQVRAIELETGFSQRMEIYARKRRLARLKLVAEAVAWTGGSAALLLIGVGGLLSLH